jgi:hypothetical protein
MEPNPMPTTWTSRHTSNGARRRAVGSAMTETVLVLPLVFVVLALLFFFGRGMTRVQRANVSDRYEAWRQAQYASAPGVSFDKHNRNFGTGGMLDDTFFGGNADALDVAERAGRVNVSEPLEILAEEITAIAGSGAPTGYEPSSAEDYVRALHRRAPAWWRIDLSTQHRTDVPLYSRFADTVHHQHTVIDGDWAFVYWMEQEHRGEREPIHRVLVDDVYLGTPSNDADGLVDLYNYRPFAAVGLYYTYYEDLDEPLEALEAQENSLAGSVRNIYMLVPDYIGRQILPELDTRFTRLDTAGTPDPGQDP